MTNTNELTARLTEALEQMALAHLNLNLLCDVYRSAYEDARHDGLVNWEAAASLAEENEDLKRKLEARIASLEARTLTVKLPQDEGCQPFGFAKWANSKLPASTGKMTISYCEDAWREALDVLASAAGLKLQIEGE